MPSRVLLVEDEADAREILEFYLDSIFDEVCVATNGEEGLKLFLQNKAQAHFFDVVITDIKMPLKDGMQMIEEMQQHLEEQKFIIVSAYKNEEHLLKSINLNVLGYFVKPLDVDNMMQMLKKAKAGIKAKINPEEKQNDIVLNESFTYNLAKKQLLFKNTPIKLSKKEAALLEVLLESLGEIVSHESLKQSLWNDPSTSDATLRTVVKRLKDKIKEDDFIISRKGHGYIIEE